MNLPNSDLFTKYSQSGKNQMENEETPLDNIKQYTYLPSHSIPGFQQKQEKLLGLTIFFVTALHRVKAVFHLSSLF